MRKMELLRRQIRRDATASPASYAAGLGLAKGLLNEIAEIGVVVPEVKTVISTLEPTLEAFYTASPHRGWAQQFALYDIQKLEELIPSEDGIESQSV
jgi:hypothetical protein